MLHLLNKVVQQGANLQTKTPVTEVSETPLPDGRWLVSTDRGSIKAKKVLFAANAYTSSLAPQFRNHIVPVRGICSRIVVPEGSTAPFLPQTYALRSGPQVYDYLIPRPDGSIIVGGGKPTFWFDRSNWYDVADDSKLIEPAKSYFDGLMQRHFIGWEHSGAYTDRVWTGSAYRPTSVQTKSFANACPVMGYSSDFMPYVGDVPGKPGQIVMAGFSGHGMPAILLTAKGVVQMLRHGAAFEDTGVPLLYRVTEERLKSTKNEIINGWQKDVFHSKD